MKVLIFGGSGIISSEVTNLAISKGIDVTIANRGRRKEFINPEANVIICDLKNDSIESICDKLENYYDVIIDVVSYTNEDLRKNIEIAKNRCKQYIFFSTAVVYKTKEGRYSENDSSGNTDWSYSIHKMECEKNLKSSALSNGFLWTIIRPYITYGKSRIPYQFAPLEYYTIINRAKHQKVIPVLNREVYCTLTYSADFATGLVGLIGNEKAYNQLYNIVGNYETTWNSILKETMAAFNIEYETIPLSETVFKNKKLIKGIDVAEVLGDKGRDMLFDNKKIKTLVPEFTGKTSYSEILPDIIEYYSDPSHQKINYAWDARVDYFLSHLPELTKEQKRKLVFSAGANATNKDKLLYFFNRYSLTFFMFKLYKKIKRFV